MLAEGQSATSFCPLLSIDVGRCWGSGSTRAGYYLRSKRFDTFHHFCIVFKRWGDSNNRKLHLTCACASLDTFDEVVFTLTPSVCLCKWSHDCLVCRYYRTKRTHNEECDGWSPFEEHFWLKDDIYSAASGLIFLNKEETPSPPGRWRIHSYNYFYYTFLWITFSLFCFPFLSFIPKILELSSTKPFLSVHTDRNRLWSVSHWDCVAKWV